MKHISTHNVYFVERPASKYLYAICNQYRTRREAEAERDDINAFVKENEGTGAKLATIRVEKMTK